MKLINATHVKELLKSVHICQSYRKNKSGTFLWPTVYILPYRNCGLISKGFKDIAQRCRPHHDDNLSKKPHEYRINLTLPKRTVPELHFTADS